MTEWQSPAVRQVVFGLIGLLALTTGCQTSPYELPAVPKSKLFLEFTAKWWSEDQMDGLNTDDPPKKNTEIRLEQWESSDPIGTPHPGEFDIVAIVGITSEVKQVWIDVAWRWSIGRLSKTTITQWTPWEMGDRIGPLEVSSAFEKRVLLHTVQIDALQQQLFEQGQWPWVFEARAVLIVDGEPVGADLEATLRMDILAGD